MILTLENLVVTHDELVLSDPLSITIFSGAIVVLYGQNGIGKTTILRMIAGVHPLSSDANIYLDGQKIHEVQKPYLNLIEHELGLFDQLTVNENLEFWSRAYDSEISLPSALSYFDIEHLSDRKVIELSAGNKKKVALCRLICCNSNLWLLDESDVNLDEANKQLLYNLITIKANNGGVIVMSGHNSPHSAFPDAINLPIIARSRFCEYI